MVMADSLADGTFSPRDVRHHSCNRVHFDTTEDALDSSLAIVDKTLFDKWTAVGGRILPPCLHHRPA
jgi:hypothetical protein